MRDGMFYLSLWTGTKEQVFAFAVGLYFDDNDVFVWESWYNILRLILLNCINDLFQPLTVCHFLLLFLNKFIINIFLCDWYDKWHDHITIIPSLFTALSVLKRPIYLTYWRHKTEIVAVSMQSCHFVAPVLLYYISTKKRAWENHAQSSRRDYGKESTFLCY